MEDEIVGRENSSKSGRWEEMMTHLTTTVWLLKIPVFFLTLALFMCSPQSHPSFPFLLLSFLPLLLLLPRFALGCQTSMPLVLVKLLTCTTDLFVFVHFSFSPRKSREWFRFLALQAPPFSFLKLYLADFGPFHLS